MLMHVGKNSNKVLISVWKRTILHILSHIQVLLSTIIPSQFFNYLHKLQTRHQFLCAYVIDDWVKNAAEHIRICIKLSPINST